MDRNLKFEFEVCKVESQGKSRSAGFWISWNWRRGFRSKATNVQDRYGGRVSIPLVSTSLISPQTSGLPSLNV